MTTLNNDTELIKTKEGKVFFDYFQAQLQLCSESFAYFDDAQKKQALASILFAAVKESSDTLLILANQIRYRNCMVIARCVFETLVNSLYILASDDDVAQRAVDHSNAKLARDLDRQIVVGSSGLRIFNTAASAVLEDNAIQEVIAKFTTATGKEKRQWTDDNLAKRIEKVGKEFGDKIVTALLFPFIYYRHASDVLHGTLYGLSHSLGISHFERPTSEKEHELHRRDNICSLLLGLGGSLGESTRIVARVCHSKELLDKAILLNNEYLSRIKDANKEMIRKKRSSKAKNRD